MRKTDPFLPSGRCPASIVTLRVGISYDRRSRDTAWECRRGTMFWSIPIWCQPAGNAECRWCMLLCRKMLGCLRSKNLSKSCTPGELIDRMLKALFTTSTHTHAHSPLKNAKCHPGSIEENWKHRGWLRASDTTEVAKWRSPAGSRTTPGRPNNFWCMNADWPRSMDAPEPRPFSKGTASGMRLKKEKHMAAKLVCYNVFAHQKAT